jgi:protein disulfide-isomerase-like protein
MSIGGNSCIKVGEENIKMFMIIGGFILLIIFLYINKKNNKSIIGGNNPTTFVLYYVDWCPHCKTVKPEWEKLENDSNLNNITVEKVNCDKNEAVARENNIEGFPTILFTHNGKVESYEGGREYADFKQYLNSKNI